jgi:hypothetical protein
MIHAPSTSSARLLSCKGFERRLACRARQQEDQEEHTGAVAQESADLKARVEADEAALKANANAADGTELTCPSSVVWLKLALTLRRGLFAFMTLIPEEYSTADFVGYWE